MKNILVTILIAAVVSWGVAHYTVPQQSVGQKNSEDKFLARIESTGEVRCGYVNNPPFVSRDPNTNQFSGIMVDVTAKVGQILGWKIVWSGETTYSTMQDDLAQGKFDVFCGGSWPIAANEKRQWWSGPLFYSGVGAFVRADDKRFDNNFDLHRLNDPAYSISVLDGVAVDRVRALDFPKMKVVSLPALSSYGEMITQVVDRKADIVLIENETAANYMKANPGKIRRIGGNKPIRFYGIGYEFSFDAPRLRNAFEAATHELVYGGDVDQILTAYEVVPEMFYRVASPTTVH